MRGLRPPVYAYLLLHPKILPTQRLCCFNQTDFYGNFRKRDKRLVIVPGFKFAQFGNLLPSPLFCKIKLLSFFTVPKCRYGKFGGVVMQTLTGSLDVNNIVSSVFQRKLEKHRVGRSHKSRKERPQQSVLIKVSKKMLEHDTEQFSDLFDKHRYLR